MPSFLLSSEESAMLSVTSLLSSAEELSSCASAELSSVSSEDTSAVLLTAVSEDFTFLELSLLSAGRSVNEPQPASISAAAAANKYVRFIQYISILFVNNLIHDNYNSDNVFGLYP